MHACTILCTFYDLHSRREALEVDNLGKSDLNLVLVTYIRRAGASQPRPTATQTANCGNAHNGASLTYMKHIHTKPRLQ